MCTTRWAPRYWCNWWNPEDADDLKKQGIVYAPDFIINAGGALYPISTESVRWTEKQAREEILKTGDTLTQIYTPTDEQGFKTSDAAVKLTREKIQATGQKDS